jgi:hypothetical protein
MVCEGWTTKLGSDVAEPTDVIGGVTEKRRNSIEDSMPSVQNGAEDPAQTL